MVKATSSSLHTQGIRLLVQLRFWAYDDRHEKVIDILKKELNPKDPECNQLTSHSNSQKDTYKERDNMATDIALRIGQPDPEWVGVDQQEFQTHYYVSSLDKKECGSPP